MVLALGVRRWRNHFLRRYNGSLQRCLIISQGFFTVLPMMAGDLGVLALVLRKVSLVFQDWDAQQAQWKAEGLIVASHRQVAI